LHISNIYADNTSLSEVAVSLTQTVICDKSLYKLDRPELLQTYFYITQLQVRTGS